MDNIYTFYTDRFLKHGKLPDTYKIIREENGKTQPMPESLVGTFGQVNNMTEENGVKWIQALAEFIARSEIEKHGGQVWAGSDMRMIGIRQPTGATLTYSVAPEGKNGY